MTVPGADGGHVGRADRVEGERIRLARADPAADGQHHRIAASMVAEVGGDAVRLAMPAEQARRSWQAEAAIQSPIADADRPAGIGGPFAGTGGRSMPHRDRPESRRSGGPRPRPGKPLPNTPSRDEDRDPSR